MGPIERGSPKVNKGFKRPLEVRDLDDVGPESRKSVRGGPSLNDNYESSSLNTALVADAESPPAISIEDDAFALLLSEEGELDVVGSDSDQDMTDIWKDTPVSRYCQITGSSNAILNQSRNMW